MNLYQSNPYRILGIKANASAPEKQKVKNRIAAYIKVGKSPILDFDLSPPLKGVVRTQELIDLKSNEILSDKDKVKHALFWFVSGGTIDDIALSNLTDSKNIDKALTNLESGSQNFEINERSVSSIINHSSLEIISFSQHKDKSRLKSAINRKLDIASSDRYLSFLLNLLNPNNTTITARSIKPEIIEASKQLLKDLFTSVDEDKLFIEFFSGQKEILQELKEKKGRKLISSIKNIVRNCEEKRNRTISSRAPSPFLQLNKIARLGKTLMSDTRGLLKEVESTYGRSSIIVANIYDEVLSEVNYCGVGASNSFQENFSTKLESNVELGRQFVRDNGRTSYNEIIEMVEMACRMVNHIDTPIKSQLNQNLEAMREAKNDWVGLCGQVSDDSPPRASTYNASTSTGNEDYSGCVLPVIIGIGLLIFLCNC